MSKDLANPHPGWYTFLSSGKFGGERSIPGDYVGKQEPIIDQLPRDDLLYLLEAIENGTFKDAAGEAIYRIGVELENALLTEVETTEEDSYWV